MIFEPYSNKKLINLKSIKDKIIEDFEAEKLHHSVLFIGNRGIGKSTLVYHIANKILDFNNDFIKKTSNLLFEDVVEETDDLKDDNSTFNLIKNRKHPDLLVINKEIDSKTLKVNKEIKVSSARKINDFINLSPFISKNKVIIIDSIDEMNNSAQNAILKALEEPVKNTYIFLICHNINNILDTIKSRCREINIQNYNFEEWKNIMDYIHQNEPKDLKKEKLMELYEISSGSVSKAIDILEDNGLFLYNHIQNTLSEKILNIENLHNLAEQLNNNEISFNLFIDFIQLFLYKVLKYYSIGNIDETFKTINYNFLLKNNEKSILEKIKFTQNLLKDINVFALNKKHAVIVLFNNLI